MHQKAPKCFSKDFWTSLDRYFRLMLHRFTKLFPSKIRSETFLTERCYENREKKLIWCLAGGRHMSCIFFSTRSFFYWNHFYEFLLLFQQVRSSPFLSVGLMTTGIPKLDDQTRITFRLSISDFLGGFSSHNGIGLGMTSHSIVDSRLNSRRKVNIINRGLIRLLIGAELSAHCDRRSSGENGIRLLGNKSNY